MNDNSLVSVVIIFLNAENYIQEAIESVINQTYPYWELLLVDDGSTDRSSNIARHYVRERPDQVRYLEHPDHANRGKGASRNLGINESRGEYVAFLDADDLWLPHKLEEQVAILEVHEKAGMLYGDTLYWYSWTGMPADKERDFIPKLGVSPLVPFSPPQLLPLFLRGKAAVPCTCSILVRREILAAIGGFDETFTKVSDIYEDQAFYAKVCLHTPIIASNRCWDLYRQHPESSMVQAIETGQEAVARKFFLTWLAQYLRQHRVQDQELWWALRRERWRLQALPGLSSRSPIQNGVRWAKKWLLRAEERVSPSFVSRWLWG